VRTRPDRDHDGRIIRGYLFNCLQPVEHVLRACGSSGAVLTQKVGAGAQATRGGPGAARAGRWEPKPREHVAALELPQTGSWEPEPRGHVAVPELP
jgi:hypothetical protein